jgi:hypothetical protein
MAALAIILLVLLPAHQALATAAGDAHPGYAGAEADTCGPAVDDFSSFSGGAASRRQRHGPELEEYGGGRIVDITHAYMPGKPAYAPGATVGPVLRLKESMENGSEYNLSELHMECHTGTHLDAPGHFNQAHFAAGLDVDTLDLEVLNGELPCFLILDSCFCSPSTSTKLFDSCFCQSSIKTKFVDDLCSCCWTGPALLVDVQRHTNITGSACRFFFPSVTSLIYRTKLHLSQSVNHIID